MIIRATLDRYRCRWTRYERFTRHTLCENRWHDFQIVVAGIDLRNAEFAMVVRFTAMSGATGLKRSLTVFIVDVSHELGASILNRFGFGIVDCAGEGPGRPDVERQTTELLARS